MLPAAITEPPEETTGTVVVMSATSLASNQIRQGVPYWVDGQSKKAVLVSG